MSSKSSAQFGLRGLSCLRWCWSAPSGVMVAAQGITGGGLAGQIPERNIARLRFPAAHAASMAAVAPVMASTSIEPAAISALWRTAGEPPPAGSARHHPRRSEAQGSGIHW